MTENNNDNNNDNNINKDSNTHKFQNSIWYLTQSLCGLSRSDWNKERIFKYLDHTARRFLTKLIIQPDEITFSDRSWRGHIYSDHEKVHIVLLVMNARRQAALLHALHAIKTFRNQISRPLF